jgi:ssDNA-binding Zn-finger/Zn-ribbon topoisomerase 1
LLETYHEVGKFIAESQRDNYEQIALDTGVSELTITRSVKFFEKFPDINKLPEGKAISWHKVVNDYLPDSKRERKPKKEKLITCPECGHQFK